MSTACLFPRKYTFLAFFFLLLFLPCLQLVVRMTWDSGDVDQFVREAVEMWDECK
jgi:glycopeptide antibiotics resistance protein